MPVEPGRHGTRGAIARLLDVIGAIGVIVAIVAGLVVIGIVKPADIGGVHPNSTPGSEAQAPQVSFSRSPTPIPTAAACAEPLGVIWHPANQGVNAYSKTSLTVRLDGCTTLVVSSGHLLAPGRQECGYHNDQLCVVAYRATAPETVTIADLDAGHTWYGTTASSIANALADKHSQFFGEPNCTNGCRYVMLFEYQDGVPQAAATILP